MNSLIAALLMVVLSHEPFLQEFNADGTRITQKWGRDTVTQTFTAGEKALAVSYPSQLAKLPGDRFLVPSFMGIELHDADFPAEWRPQSYHYPGAQAGGGAHLIAPFVVRMDGARATLIALLTPIDDVTVQVSQGRVVFSYPRLAPGESITITYYEKRFASWYEAVDQARTLYGIDTEDAALYCDFWRPGYLSAGLMNATDATIEAGGFLPSYYERDLDRLLGWVQYWGQMSGHMGSCCSPVVGFHPRYQNPFGLVPLHGDVGYYARTGTDGELDVYDDMVAALRAQGGASIIYWDIVGMTRTVDPLQIRMRADEVPTFIEGASMDLPLASMVGHASLTHPNAFTELGRYFLKNRPLFAGYANVGTKEATRQVYRDCIELGMGLDSWFWYDEDMAALQRSALEAWQRVGFWEDKPQLVRRGVFQGESGKTYTVRLVDDVTTIEVTP